MTAQGLRCRLEDMATLCEYMVNEYGIILQTGDYIHSIAMSSKRIPGSRNLQTWLAPQAKTVCNFHTSHKNSDILYDNIRNDKRNARLYEALI